jgi:hypothetical protein
MTASDLATAMDEFHFEGPEKKLVCASFGPRGALGVMHAPRERAGAFQLRRMRSAPAALTASPSHPAPRVLPRIRAT